MYRYAMLSFALILASASATNVKECKKNRPFPISVDINDCDEPPCMAIKGSTAIMKVHFVGTRDNIEKITAIVHATTFGITVKHVLPEDVADVCSNLLYGAICPIYKTEDVVYDFKFYIDSSYPEISVKVEVDLVDEYQNSIACFSVDIKVRRASHKTLLANNTMNAIEWNK